MGETLRRATARPLPHPDLDTLQVYCRQVAHWVLHDFATLSDRRVADLNIEVFAQADNIDESCVSVEEILLTDPTLDGLVLSSDYTGYTLSLTNKNTNARAVCAFELMYTTEFTNAQ